jgi:hypothetical protein
MASCCGMQCYSLCKQQQVPILYYSVLHNITVFSPPTFPTIKNRSTVPEEKRALTLPTPPSIQLTVNTVRVLLQLQRDKNVCNVPIRLAMLHEEVACHCTERPKGKYNSYGHGLRRLILDLRLSRLSSLVTVFSIITLCDLLGEYERFGETYCLHLQNQLSINPKGLVWS